MNFKKYLKKYEPVLRNFPETANRFFRSERFLVYLVSLPFFGTWLIGFTFYWENQTVRKYSGNFFLKFSLFSRISFSEYFSFLDPGSWSLARKYNSSYGYFDLSRNFRITAIQLHKRKKNWTYDS